MRQKNIVIGIMCIVVCIMVIGFAAFSTTLNISGTSSIQSNWSVVFTNIQELSKSSGVTVNSNPTASGTTATFDVSLESPGDSMEYQITVANQGTLDAIIENIETTETENSALLFEVSGINKGDKLAKSTQATFNIKISYDSSITSQPKELNKTLTINITYVQDIGQVIEPDKPTLVNAILSDNTPQSDESIDFNMSSAEDGTKGLYYTSTNTEDNKITYYYRGAVENNYVRFAGYYWRIIRINEDSSIRLIYQGTTPTATGSAATIGSSEFNDSDGDSGYVGYMYGEFELCSLDPDTYYCLPGTGSSNYEQAHENINDSSIKKVIDNWYDNHLTYYEDYLSDSGFCGDRSIDEGGGYGISFTNYGGWNRINLDGILQYKCPQSNDLYTTASSTKGNRALDYPIGLITIDEVVYAGITKRISNYNSYLYINNSFWSMTPGATQGGIYTNTTNLGVNSSGMMNFTNVDEQSGVRPVINLKSTVEIVEGGDGTSSNPYVIKTN